MIDYQQGNDKCTSNLLFSFFFPSPSSMSAPVGFVHDQGVFRQKQWSVTRKYI